MKTKNNDSEVQDSTEVRRLPFMQPEFITQYPIWNMLLPLSLAPRRTGSTLSEKGEPCSATHIFLYLRHLKIKDH